MEDRELLCCCEYIDSRGEKNHLLACCCNCVEFDHCCDKLIRCQKVSRKEISNVIMNCCSRIRCPWRGGAFLLTKEMILPVLIQPLLVFFITYFKCIVFLVTMKIILLVFVSYYLSKNNVTTPIFYYWNVTSVTYISVVMECYVVSFLKIGMGEHYLLMTLSVTTIFFLYLTKKFSTSEVENHNGELLGNGIGNSNVCPICRLRESARSYHCHICQICTPKYDYHCFWLDCCIGENNRHTFLLGLLFGSSALAYMSHLMLTTICRPEFEFGVLVPKDCTDVYNDTEMSICYVCAIYSLEIVIILVLRLIYHIWLTSKGFTAHEFKSSWNRNVCSSSPYSQGFLGNWIQFLRNFQKNKIFKIPCFEDGKM